MAGLTFGFSSVGASVEAKVKEIRLRAWPHSTRQVYADYYSIESARGSLNAPVLANGIACAVIVCFTTNVIGDWQILDDVRYLASYRTHSNFP